MDTKKTLILSGSVMLVAVALVVIFYFTFILVDVQTVELHSNFENTYGFNLDTDKMYFGSVPPGEQGERDLVFANNYDFPVEVSSFFSGELEEYMRCENNNVVFQSGETGTITYTVNPPKDVTMRENYTGIAKVYIKRVLW